MRDESCTGRDALPTSVAQSLDRVCDRFEAAWKAVEHGGKRPRIEDYLGTRPEPERSALERELIALDIVYRQRAGEEPQAEEYRARFPFLDFAQLASVFTAKQPVGPDAAFADADRQTQDSPRAQPPLRPQAIRIRCPHCHNPIQLIDDRPEEVLCPGCGSSFRVREARQTTTTVPMRPLGKFQLLERVGLQVPNPTNAATNAAHRIALGSLDR
jgi:hypothetical protein